MSSVVTVEQISRAYRVPLIDYGRDGDWLLVSSGSGIMQAVMGEVAEFRWCADIDEAPDGRLADWLLWMERLCGLVAVVGWFSLTSPAPLRDAIAGLAGAPPCYTPTVVLGGVHFQTLTEFLCHLREKASQIDSAAKSSSQAMLANRVGIAASRF